MGGIPCIYNAFTKLQEQHSNKQGTRKSCQDNVKQPPQTKIFIETVNFSRYTGHLFQMFQLNTYDKYFFGIV